MFAQIHPWWKVETYFKSINNYHQPQTFEKQKKYSKCLYIIFDEIAAQFEVSFVSIVQKVSAMTHIDIFLS